MYHKLSVINKLVPFKLFFILHFCTMQVYEGEYMCDKKHGHGRYSWPSGAHFCGYFESDRREGTGVYVSPEGEKFEVS